MNENESTNTKQSDIVPVIEPIDKDYLDNETFKLWYANTFPYIETDFDAITTYKLLQKIVKFLNQVISNNNQVIDNVNIINGNVENLNEAFTQLQNYVNEYFDGIQPVQFRIIGHGPYSRTYRLTFYNDFYFDFEVHDGEPVTLFVGDTTTGEPGTDANVTITGNPPFQTLHFTIPKGEKGDQGPRGPQGLQGPANVLSVGSVTTGEPGTDAEVTISGTAPNQTIDFKIPKGEKGETGPMPDMSEYIKNTDFASNNMPGIVKSNDNYGSHIYNGSIEGVTKSYNQYIQGLHDHFLICKKTLDNILATHTRNVTLFESQNGFQGDSVANGSEITLSDAITNFDYIEIYSVFGTEDSICTKIIPNTTNLQVTDTQVINIMYSVLDYGRAGYTIPSNYFINFSYNNTTKKLSCTGSGTYEPFVDSNNNIDNRVTNTNTNAIQKIVGVKVLS